MADDESFGLDDELPPWANEPHGIPGDDAAPDDPPAAPPPFQNVGVAFDAALAAAPPMGHPAVKVGKLPSGVIKWYSQRPKPYTNCMFATLCTTLSYMGYDVPPEFIGELRDASGVPDTQATSPLDTKTALRQLLPEADLRFEAMSDDDLRQQLTAGQISARVMVHNLKLPLSLRHFTGNYDGGHAIALGPAQKADGDSKVRWLDPMGRPVNQYDGEDVDYGSFREALFRTPSGLVRVTYGRHNSAVDNPVEPEPPEKQPAAVVGGNPEPVVDVESATVLTNARVDEFVHIDKGTPFLHQRTQEEVTRASDSADFRMAGRSIDGRYYGVWVSTRRLPGAKGLTLLIVEQSRVGKPFIE